MASTSNRRGKAKTYEPWTIMEDIALCKAWCEAMENYDTRDMKKGFWLEVFANFQKEMRGTIRGYDTVVVRHHNNIRTNPCLPFLHFQRYEHEICDEYFTEKEHQQLLQQEQQLRLDEEALRETLEEEAKAEKEWDERMKKEQAEYELFRLEFGVK
ncbi:hypothetical protein Tco_1204188 [Tanacetum coccineum]